MLALSGLAPQADAATITFLQFSQRSASQSFTLTGGPGGIDTLSTVVPVSVTLSQLGPLPGPLTNPINATFQFNATSSNAVQSFGGFGIQGGYSGTFSFTLDTPYFGQTDLLSGTFGSTRGGTLTGQEDGSSGGFSASTRNTALDSNVLFSSSFLRFAPNSQENFALSLSSINPGVNIFDSRFEDFSSAIVGTFAAQPLPTIIPPPLNTVPEPITLVGTAVGFFIVGLAQRRRRS